VHQFSSHVSQRGFHLLVTADVDSKDQNPALNPLGSLPRPNLPLNPHRAIFTVPAVFLSAHRFASQGTAVNLLSSLRKIRKHVVMRTPEYLRTVHSVIDTKAITDLNVANLTIEHRNSSRNDFKQDL